MMLTISPLMTLIAFVILPISALLISLVIKHSQKYFFTQQEYLGKINGQVEEVFSGQNVIKVFNREEVVKKTFEEDNDVLYQSAWKSQFFSGMMQTDHDVCRKSRLCCSSDQRKYVSDQRNDRGRRYSGIYPVCQVLPSRSHRWHRYRICFSPWRATERVFEFLEEEEEDQFAENPGA